MSLLVFDIESTGLPHRDRPLTDQEQPRIVQIGAIVYSAAWEEISMFSTVIRPDGWSSNAGAQAAHGISDRRCQLYGVRIKAALAMFMDFVRVVPEIASYGMMFDSFVIDVELALLGAKPEEWTRGGLRRTCVMEEAAQRFSSGKFMKLPAAHEKATGEEYMPVHQSLPDSRAAARILRSLRNGG